MHDPEFRQPHFRPILSISPSPENDKIYGPVDTTADAFLALVDSIQKNGLLQPIEVTSDGYIISGHRRYAACKATGMTQVKVVICDVSRADDKNLFLLLLTEHNRQRIKSNDVIFREELARSNTDDPYKDLLQYRIDKAKSAIEDSEGEVIEFTENRGHNSVTEFRMPFLEAVLKVLEAGRKYWPLSVRQIHYRLLNDPPLRDSRKNGELRVGSRTLPKKDSTYRNDRESYNALVNLCRDARLDGLVTWSAIDDPTRPVTTWDVHDSPDTFIKAELDDFLNGYSRNLQRTQPTHIELFAEKNTLAGILRPIASRYVIPLTIGRGCCSIAPIRKMVNRFKRSGKEKLIILAIADFDPAGIMIARSFCQRVHDYFHIPLSKIEVRKIALTEDQTVDLPVGGNVGDKSDVNAPYFVEHYGEETYEVEALEPEELERLTVEAIESVLDVDVFNAEVEAEKVDWEFLSAKRRIMAKLMLELPDHPTI
jgi:ParB-like nuclease domain